MSMKRTKQRGSGGREKETDGSFWDKPAEPERSWEEQVEGKPEESFLPYALSERFTKGQLVVHAKFGRGVVVDADQSRVEILFQEGKKKLGHGQVT